MADHLTPAEAARLLTMSVSWLEKRRRDGTGPPWHNVPGTRRVYYDRAELDRWMSGRPTKQARPLTWEDTANLQAFLDRKDTE